MDNKELEKKAKFNWETSVSISGGLSDKQIYTEGFKEGYEQGQMDSDSDYTYWAARYAEKDKENAELKAQIEKMKCCWNCEHFNSEGKYCKLDKSSRSFWDDCNKWELAE